LLTIEVIHSDLEILRKFGELKAILGTASNILADADIFIAATALAKRKMTHWHNWQPMYLTPYWPDINLIERIWLVMKARWFNH